MLLRDLFPVWKLAYLKLYLYFSCSFLFCPSKGWSKTPCFSKIIRQDYVFHTFFPPRLANSWIYCSKVHACIMANSWTDRTKMHHVHVYQSKLMNLQNKSASCTCISKQSHEYSEQNCVMYISKQICKSTELKCITYWPEQPHKSTDYQTRKSTEEKCVLHISNYTHDSTEPKCVMYIPRQTHGTLFHQGAAWLQSPVPETVCHCKKKALSCE